MSDIQNKSDNNISHNADNHLIIERKAKLNQIRNIRKNAYPNSFKPTITAYELHQKYDEKTNEELNGIMINVKVAGRVMLKRIMGKSSFITLKDNNYNIQLYVNKDMVDSTIHQEFIELDIGDIIGVSGVLFKTKTNELSIKINSCELISKNLRPLPEKFHGLTNQELCYRQRYVDLIMNKDTQDLFIKRSKIIQSIRNTLLIEDYLEVETPMMHQIPGGATAKPFITHHNTLNIPLYLRVAPELYLKRLIIGGFNRVFEINRNFRNEGLSTRHNPEFTMVEFYESYANYTRMMEITEIIIRNTAALAIGSLEFEYQGTLVDLSKPFDKLTICDAIIKYNPEYSKNQLEDKDFLRNELHRFTNNINKNASIGMLQLKLFEETTESKLWNPTYIIDYPVDISPLARLSDTDCSITERFELFIVGREIANGYSELNDPEEQAMRFKKQVEQKDNGDEEAMHYDADYINALEYGMPHTGGCGIGIDRLVMLIANAASIKDVILFPQMKPEC